MNNDEIVRRWYVTTISTMLILVVIYIISHTLIPGAEIIKLSKQEITDINLILFGTDSKTDKSADTKGGTTASKDSAKKESRKDSSNNSNKNLPATESKPKSGLDSSNTSDSIRKATVYDYIFSVRGPLCKNDSVALRKHFESFNNMQFAMVIANFPIRVKSYFWLTEGNGKPFLDYCGELEGSVYLEIIFWTWFGLIASLLFSVSEALQAANFDTGQISIHISKFFYAPPVSLIIYFSINQLVSDGATSMAEFSHGTVVLAFILGFFSRRAIDLIDRLKELILPINSNRNSVNQR